MRLEGARRLLESIRGPEFRDGCGELPNGLEMRVASLEALARDGQELYRQRADHVVREPWEQPAPLRRVQKKPSKNTARRIRVKRRKAREQGEVSSARVAQVGASGTEQEGGRGMDLMRLPQKRFGQVLRPYIE